MRGGVFVGVEVFLITLLQRLCGEVSEVARLQDLFHFFGERFFEAVEGEFEAAALGVAGGVGGVEGVGC